MEPLDKSFLNGLEFTHWLKPIYITPKIIEKSQNLEKLLTQPNISVTHVLFIIDKISTEVPFVTFKEIIRLWRLHEEWSFRAHNLSSIRIVINLLRIVNQDYDKITLLFYKPVKATKKYLHKWPTRYDYCDFTDHYYLIDS